MNEKAFLSIWHILLIAGGIALQIVGLKISATLGLCLLPLSWFLAPKELIRFNNTSFIVAYIITTTFSSLTILFGVSEWPGRRFMLSCLIIFFLSALIMRLLSARSNKPKSSVDMWSLYATFLTGILFYFS
jgi:hypothetical protein